jgi:Flp pilus assembly protein TadG
MNCKLVKNEQGGIVLEAALLLPLFMAFIVFLIMFIQISLAEMALHSAVSETAKSIATQLYPMKLLVQEAKSKYDQSKASSVIDSAVTKVQSARSKVIDAEQFIDDYSAYIPDQVIEILKLER